MSLPSCNTRFKPVLDLSTLVSGSVKAVHALKHLIAFVKTSIQVYFVLHGGNGVVYSGLREPILVLCLVGGNQRDLESSAQIRIHHFDAASVGGTDVLEHVQTIVQNY